MSYELVHEVFFHAPASIKRTQRLVLLAIAERSRYRNVPWWIETEVLAQMTGLGPSGVRQALQGLAEAGYDVRVALGKDKDGEPFYAVRGKAPQYLLPDFPAPESCRCNVCLKGASDEPPLPPLQAQGASDEPPLDTSRPRATVIRRGRRGAEGGSSQPDKRSSQPDKRSGEPDKRLKPGALAVRKSSRRKYGDADGSAGAAPPHAPYGTTNDLSADEEEHRQRTEQAVQVLTSAHYLSDQGAITALFADGANDQFCRAAAGSLARSAADLSELARRDVLTLADVNEWLTAAMKGDWLDTAAYVSWRAYYVTTLPAKPDGDEE